MKGILDKLIDVDIKPKQIAFNSLNLMYQRVREKEQIHSEILGGYLNPNENHSLGVIPLQLFLEMDLFNEIDLGDINYDKVIITLERIVTTPKNAERRIDILIEWKDLNEKKKAIIIENKLNYAVDQDSQINDYHDGLVLDGYEVLGVVYMPFLSKFKRSKDTDTKKEILKKTVDLDASDLIEWLSKIQSEEVDLSGIIQYKLFLECLKNENNNKMKAMEIINIKDLTNEEVIKLENLVKLISTVEWCEARFSGISSAIQNKIGEIKIIYKKHKDGRNYAQYCFEFNDEYWIELWIEKEKIELFIVSKSSKTEGVTIDKTNFVYDSSYSGYYYYKNETKYRFNYITNDDELINYATELLNELKK